MLITVDPLVVALFGYIDILNEMLTRPTARSSSVKKTKTSRTDSHEVMMGIRCMRRRGEVIRTTT